MENDLISRQKLIDDLEAWRKRLDRRVSRFDDMVIHALPAVFDLVIEQETVDAEPKWISVKERPPENFETVIIWRNDCRNACIGWLIDDRWSVPKGVKVTHWMPLPKPPKEES